MNELQALEKTAEGGMRELEKTLAELLGFTVEAEGGYFWHPGDTYFTDPAPRWTTDNAAAFQLMIAHKITVWVGEEAVSAYQNLHDFLAGESVSNHPDRATAVRVVIVKAVIKKLGAQHVHQT